jgi:hypothetical protein
VLPFPVCAGNAAGRTNGDTSRLQKKNSEPTRLVPQGLARVIPAIPPLARDVLKVSVPELGVIQKL